MDDDDAEYISLEKTNELRAQLGLPPIPAEDGSGAGDAKDEPVAQRQASATTTMNDAGNTGAEEISLEETNRMRQQLGLSLIEPEAQGTTTQLQSSVDQDKQARENWVKLKQQQDEREQKLQRQKDEERAREREIMSRKLEGESLGAGGGGAKSTASFLKSLKKKRGVKSAAAQELEEEAEQGPEYTEKDLSGLKVGHSLEDFQNLADNTVLTLKDQSVLDDDQEDVLESASIREKESTTENLRNKRGVQKFNGWEDSWFDRAKELEQESFTLGSEAMAAAAAKQKQEQSTEQSDNLDINLEFKEPKKASKPKFKKRKKAVVEAEPVVPKRRYVEEDDPYELLENDDEALQAALRKTRRKLQKQRDAVKSVDEITDRILSARSTDPRNGNEDGGNNVESDGSSSFLQNIRQKKSDTREYHEGVDEEEEEQQQESADVEMGQVEDDNQHVDKPETSKTPLFNHDVKSVDNSIAASLKRLNQSGLMKAETEPDEKRRKRQQAQSKKAELNQWYNRELERRKERERQGKIGRMSMRELEAWREDQNTKLMDEYYKRSAEIMKDYRFDHVDISHRDAAGNVLTEKDAYKQLSHHFHGNAPGKQKQEKQLKRRKEEKKKMAESIFK